MRRIRKNMAAALVVVMMFSFVMTGYAAAQTPSCDETLYITLDGAGEIEESSVVKRYGNCTGGEIVDYGIYEQVSNLTNRAEPVRGADGSVRFALEESDRTFYFEGKMEVTARQLPWTVKTSYLLNGVEKQPEELAGATGLVEIHVDLIPNKQVSAYYRNNMALTMAAVVDMDQNLSVRADGAQIQGVGNMKAVVFFALPGEECHYTIAIGSEDFEFTGLIFMMVPLTLAQLDEVADLRDAKETLEDSADALSDSMDIILDTMEQMQAGISDTSSGLRGLDDARNIISSTKGAAYDQADDALAKLGDLSEALKPFQEHTAQAQNALNEIRHDINEMVCDVNELEPKLGDLKDTVRYLRDDIAMIQDALNSPRADLAAASFVQLLEKTRSDLGQVKASQQALVQAIQGLGQAMGQMKANGVDLRDYAALVRGLDADTGYDADELQDLIDYLSDDMDLIDDLNGEGSAGTRLGLSVAKASPSGWTISSQMQPAVMQLMQATAGLAGNTGVTDDLDGMLLLTEQMLAMLDSQKGNLNAAVSETKDLLSVTGKICAAAEDITGDIDELNQTLERYHPEMIKMLGDAGALTDRAVVGVDSLQEFFTTLENQIRTAGGPLDEGTKKTLNGLADMLDHLNSGLGQTKVIRDAKNTIKDTIDDKWEEFSDEHTTILDIDLEAKPVSLTSEKNPSPDSIQIIMRTKEITKDDSEDTAGVDENYYPDGNVFHRIANIFRRIWAAICSLFQ